MTELMFQGKDGMQSAARLSLACPPPISSEHCSCDVLDRRQRPRRECLPSKKTYEDGNSTQCRSQEPSS